VPDSTIDACLSVRRPSTGAVRPYAQPMLLTEIQTALAGAMVETRYQPVVRLADRVPVSFEALVRINHPSRGTLLPETFVPQIEDAGLAGQLTDLVVACAFADMTGAALAPPALPPELPPAGPPLGGLSVSLNFPLDVLVGTTALARLESRRQAAGIPAGQVVIELTESQPVGDLEALRGAVEHLRCTGYQIVIDDVSPEVAGLDQLLDLPFTGIKLDQHLVHQLASVPAAVAEVERVIRIARLRALTVVAEGVETAELWHQLTELGADQAQGFLISHALPAAVVPAWLKSWQELPAF
jgi:EAL domain-containing protein (putative c-di-GMP-specific phosphodiesterase class I)